MIVDAAIATMLHRCAPAVGTRTMAAIVQYESGWKPWSIDDDTAHRSYHFNTEVQAVTAAAALAKAGHNFDAGLAQVNSSNFGEYRLTIRTAFDPCSNLHAGAAIIANAYLTAFHTNWLGRPIRTAADLYAQQQQSLIHAFSAYNSGREWAAMGYANNVYRIGLRTTIGSVLTVADRPRYHQ